MKIKHFANHNQLCFFCITLLSAFFIINAAAVSVTDANDGQAAFKIKTDKATYYFHKAGGGFSSIIDKDKTDWVDWNKSDGWKGMYRGIPNMVVGKDYFHPGHNHCKSSIEGQSSGDSVSIKSGTRDGKWQVRWTFYPTHATMTVLKTGGNYWFLYEGTPGGTFEGKTDWWMNSEGTKKTARNAFEQDLPSPEWICFGDPDKPRVLFFSHHEDDNLTDCFRSGSGKMTVFGFGRKGTSMEIKSKDSFSIGFIESTEYSKIKAFISNVGGDGSTNVSKQALMPSIQSRPYCPKALYFDKLVSRTHSLTYGLDGKRMPMPKASQLQCPGIYVIIPIE